MSDKGTIEQLRAELAQARRRLAIPDQLCGYCGYRYSAGTNEANFAVLTEHIKSCPRHPLAKVLAELAQAQTEIARINKILDGYVTGWADACAARDALAHECNQLEESREYNAQLVEERDRTIAHVRRELKGPQAANQECGRLLAQRTNSRDYWVRKCQAAEIERDQIRKEAEGLRRQLAKAQIQAATPKEAVEWLWGFYDGNTLIAKPGYEDDIREAWNRLLVAVDSITGDALLERLTTLDAAEAALADCNLGGVETKFNGLPNAIEGMAEHIKELSGQLSEAELAAHVHDKTCGELAQTVRTEQAVRQEAEKRTEQVLRQTARITHLALNDCGVPNRDDNGNLANVNTRILWLHRRAERAEAELKRGHQTLTHLGMPLGNEITGRIEQMLRTERGLRQEAEQRAERAEALAALVTPELERLLEKLASHTQELAGAKIDIYAEPLEFRIRHWLSDTRVARKLAAQIREALDEH